MLSLRVFALSKKTYSGFPLNANSFNEILLVKEHLFSFFVLPSKLIYNFRQTGWIGTVEVNRDTGLKPGETQRQSVSPGLSPASQFTSAVPIYPV